MKIVVIGGTGLIGSKLVNLLSSKGHKVLSASPNSGVNTITGEGLADALAGADVVVDVSNSPSFENAAVLKFFQTSTANVLAAETNSGVKHHVALSIVGADRLSDSGYMRAKVAQESLVRAGKVPYTILRSTQFFEFIDRIAEPSPDGKSVTVSNALFQPIAADNVVEALADIAISKPANAIVEIGGPERLRMGDLVQRVASAKADPRAVVIDAHTRYFGATLDDHSLVAGNAARIGAKYFEAWLRETQLPQPAHATA